MWVLALPNGLCADHEVSVRTHYFYHNYSYGGVCANHEIVEEALLVLALAITRLSVCFNHTVSSLHYYHSHPPSPPHYHAHPPAHPFLLPSPLQAAIEAHARSTGRPAPLLVDLSADKRFDDSGEWAYGLPERPGAAAAIAKVRREGGRERERGRES